MGSSRVARPCGAHAERCFWETWILPSLLTGVLAGTCSSLACCTPTLLFQFVSAEAHGHLHHLPNNPLWTLRDPEQRGYILTTDQSDTGSVGIFSRRTNQHFR
eukprot:475928-Pyramimonas_sp.AAC.3